jgi:hypothetical protein
MLPLTHHSSDHPGWLVRRSQQPPTSAHWAQSRQSVGNIYYRFGASALFMREKLGGGTLSTPNRLAPPLPADRGHLDDTAVRINRHCRNDRRPWHRSLLSFAREVVSDHGSADFGSASVRMDYAGGVVFEGKPPNCRGSPTRGRSRSTNRRSRVAASKELGSARYRRTYRRKRRHQRASQNSP